MSILKRLFGISATQPPEIAFVRKHKNRVVVGIIQDFELELLDSENDRREAIEVSYESHKLLSRYFLKVAEASDKYHVSVRKLRKLCKSKTVLGEKVSGMWLIREDSLIAYLRSD